MYDINGNQVNKPTNDDEGIFDLKLFKHPHSNPGYGSEPDEWVSQKPQAPKGNGFGRNNTVSSGFLGKQDHKFQRRPTAPEPEEEEPEGDFINLDFPEHEAEDAMYDDQPEDENGTQEEQGVVSPILRERVNSQGVRGFNFCNEVKPAVKPLFPNHSSFQGLSSLMNDGGPNHPHSLGTLKDGHSSAHSSRASASELPSGSGSQPTAYQPGKRATGITSLLANPLNPKLSANVPKPAHPGLSPLILKSEPSHNFMAGAFHTQHKFGLKTNLCSLSLPQSLMKPVAQLSNWIAKRRVLPVGRSLATAWRVHSAYSRFRLPQQPEDHQKTRHSSRNTKVR